MGIDYKVRAVNRYVTWQAPLNSSCTYREALFDLAYAGGMAAVGCGTFAYSLGRMKDHIDKKKLNWERRAMDHFRVAQKAAIQRLALDALLKKTLLLKIQVSLYAIDRSISFPCGTAKWNDIDWMNLLPLVVTLLTGLASQLDLFTTCMAKQWLVHTEISGHVEKLGSQEQETFGRLRFFSVVILVLFALCVWGISYSVVQMFALHACPTSLWNFKGFSLETWFNDGCVSLDTINALNKEYNQSGGCSHLTHIV